LSQNAHARERARLALWCSLHDTVFAAVMIVCNGSVGFKIEFGFLPNLFGHAPSFASGSQ